jgi:hypothetical protein
MAVKPAENLLLLTHVKHIIRELQGGVFWSVIRAGCYGYTDIYM